MLIKSEIKVPQGWLSGYAVGEFEKLVSAASDGAKFLEIGSWVGRSTIVMADLIRKSGKQIQFWACDTWLGSDEHIHRQMRQQIQQDVGRDLFGCFLNNLMASNLEEFVIPLRMKSVEALSLFGANKLFGELDFVYVDGSHEYSDVVSDLQLSAAALSDSGSLIVDDAGWESVNAAVQYVFGDSVLYSPDRRIAIWRKQ